MAASLAASASDGAIGRYVREVELVELLDGIFKTTRRIAQSQIERDHPAPDPLPTLTSISNCLQQFIGTIAQTPPAWSAVHVNGQRAYDLARAGRDFTLSARDVDVPYGALRLAMLDPAALVGPLLVAVAMASLLTA